MPVLSSTAAASPSPMVSGSAVSTKTTVLSAALRMAPSFISRR